MRVREKRRSMDMGSPPKRRETEDLQVTCTGIGIHRIE